MSAKEDNWPRSPGADVGDLRKSAAWATKRAGRDDANRHFGNHSGFTASVSDQVPDLTPPAEAASASEEIPGAAIAGAAQTQRPRPI